jgi:hypothetical protein
MRSSWLFSVKGRQCSIKDAGRAPRMPHVNTDLAIGLCARRNFGLLRKHNRFGFRETRLRNKMRPAQALGKISPMWTRLERPTEDFGFVRQWQRFFDHRQPAGNDQPERIILPIDWFVQRGGRDGL